MNFLKKILNIASFLFLLILWYGICYQLYLFITYGSLDLFKGDSVSFHQIKPFLIVAVPLFLLVSLLSVKQLTRLHSWGKHILLLFISAALLGLYLASFLIYVYADIPA